MKWVSNLIWIYRTREVKVIQASETQHAATERTQEFYRATGYRNSTGTQATGTLQGHRLQELYRDTGYRNSTGTQATGTLQSHRLQELYRATGYRNSTEGHRRS